MEAIPPKLGVFCDAKPPNPAELLLPIDEDDPNTAPEDGLAPKVFCPSGLENAAPLPNPDGDPNAGLLPKAGEPPKVGAPPNPEDAVLVCEMPPNPPVPTPAEPELKEPPLPAPKPPELVGDPNALGP